MSAPGSVRVLPQLTRGKSGLSNEGVGVSEVDRQDQDGAAFDALSTRGMVKSHLVETT